MSGEPLISTFNAWHNIMPGGPHSLHVAGLVRFPTGGWTPHLVRTEPQGTNPAILLLKLTATPPTGRVDEAFSNEPVHYAESPGDGITEVTIRHDDGEFTIKVQTVT